MIEKIAGVFKQIINAEGEKAVFTLRAVVCIKRLTLSLVILDEGPFKKERKQIEKKRKQREGRWKQVFWI